MQTTLPEHFEELADACRMGFLRVKELKDRGENICGTFCQYTPAEIIRATGLYQVYTLNSGYLQKLRAASRQPWLLVLLNSVRQIW